MTEKDLMIQDLRRENAELRARMPIVQCKDCKHWHKDTMFCGYMSYGEASERVNWYADDFCSYGERKEGAN